MLTALLIAFPLLASIVVFLTKGQAARNITLAATIIEFIISIIALVQFRNDPNAASLSMNCEWVKSFGINFAVTLDGLGILLVLLTTFLLPLIVLSSYNNTYENAHSFYGLVLTMQA